MIDFIDLRTQQEKIRNDLNARMQKVLAHGKYIMGPEIEELENRLSEYVGVKHAITCGNWTDGLTICLMALGVGRGDEVITADFSFFATAEAIAILGAKPVFADIKPETYNLDSKQIEALITPKTKAIIPVSLYGQCADMNEINAIAERHGLSVLEDGAQSFGAEYRGKKSGALSLIGGTSFFPSKPLGCYGDGGACFTDDDALAKELKKIRAHGQERRYYHTRLGVNSRLDSLQAAILLAKLEIFDEEIERRQEVAGWFEKYLRNIVKTPKIESWNKSVFAQYTIEVEEREAFCKELLGHGIPTCVHYPLPLSQQPAMLAEFPNPKDLPHSLRAAERVVSLPMHPYLLESEVKKISEAVESAVGNAYQKSFAITVA